MSPRLLERRAADLATLYWVMGGCYGDESETWRRWSEVVGPFANRDSAEALRQRMLTIFEGNPLVHFEVVTRPA